MDLNTIWFLLVSVLIGGYAVLDGFDLGVGVLHLFARSDEERDTHVAVVGPVWDGNEVWLLTGGGALFAAFPVVYATVFSGFYLALMLLLAALIMRAVSLEFRHAHASARWVRAWDYAFGIGSLLPSVLFGVAVGNVLRGVPIDRDATWAGSFLGLLNPYSVVVGLVSLALFTLHGAAYLWLKSDGDLAARLRRWIPRLWGAFVAVYGVATALSLLSQPHLFRHVAGNLLFWALCLLLFASVAAIPIATAKGSRGLTFLASATTIVAMIGVAAVSMYPTLVHSSIDPAYSLTIYNASSTPRTLFAMFVIALIGMPLVIGYTLFAYRVFKGKATPSSVYGAH